MEKLIKQTVYLPVKEANLEENYYLQDLNGDFYSEQKGYFFTDLEIQDIFTTFARENNISQEKVKIFLNDNFN